MHGTTSTGKESALADKDKAKFKGQGEATVENVDTGEKSKIEFSGEATVSSLSEKKAEKAVEAGLCPECGDELTRYGNRYICTNVTGCKLAQAQATTGATTTKAKAAAAAPPRAFRQSGGVD